MWQLVNRTPYAAAQGWVRDLNGAETWLVVVKATFDVLDDGSATIAPEQPPPSRTPVYRGQPGRSSILYDSDFVLAKTTTDIIVNGTAYAPGTRPVLSVDVAVTVGSISKSLRVFGDRSWDLRGLLSSPVPFVAMPITYERAFGGIDPGSQNPDVDWYWPNPVGTGFAAGDRGVLSLRAPNIEYATDNIRSWKARPRPAGFGVIGPNWRERADLAGTYDKDWADHRQPLLPHDFDMRHFQSVPSDQQAPAFLSGGEAVSLVNLTPSGRLTFVLPTVDLQFESRFTDDERRAHGPARLHTVILEPDAPSVSLVWHTALECHTKAYKLDHTRITSPSLYPDEEDEPIGSLLEI